MYNFTYSIASGPALKGATALFFLSGSILLEITLASSKRTCSFFKLVAALPVYSGVSLEPPNSKPIYYPPILLFYVDYIILTGDIYGLFRGLPDFFFEGEVILLLRARSWFWSEVRIF